MQRAQLESLLGGLNAKQRQAVTAPDGPLLILAGAGTGKTLTLTTRVAYLTGTGRCRAENVLAITFTNKAADSLAKRVADAVGGEQARKATIGTFHAACHRQIRPYAEWFGRTERFTIYDAESSRKLLRQAIKEEGAEEIELKVAVREIGLAKAELMTPAQYRKRHASYLGQVVASVYAGYEKMLKASDALDFDDLILCAVKVLRRREMLKRFQKRWRVIVVDEFQDTNFAQYEWVRLLASGERNITVVGDDDQSIYAFRGADFCNILRFEKDFPEAKVLALEQNYRSSRGILLAATNVVRRNQNRKEKRLFTEVSGGPEVRVLGFSSEQEEADAVAKWCQALIAHGTDPSQIAILYRTNEQRRSVERELLITQTPYRVLGGMSSWEHKEVKDALAHLAVVVNPRDTVNFARALSMQPGIGAAAVSAVQTHAKDCGIDLLRASEEAQEVEGLKVKQAATVEAFGKTLREIAAGQEDNGVGATVLSTMMASGLVKGLKRKRCDPSGEKIERIRDLLRAARAYEKQDANPRLEEFIATTALVAHSDEGEQGKVVLATIHSAKGLEWACVRVIGLEEGLFPHSRSLRSADGEEEERRLCYVAMTRARRHLVLSWSSSRSRRGGRMPSRFIQEAEVA